MKKTIRDIDIANQSALVRVDFNVPLDEQGRITSDDRILGTLPTVKYLLERGASIMLCSHLGRPGGKQVDRLSLRVVAEHLSKLLNRSVQMAKDCIGPNVEEMASNLESRGILMLENLRFHHEEETNDDEFARALASLAEIYVNDAFGACHRAHASIVGVPKHLPAVAGLLLEKELKTLGSLLENPEHPFGGLFGGAKVSDKVATLENIMDKLDFLLIGGAMAALFLKAAGYEIGQSEVELYELDTASTLMKKVAGNGTKLLLPIDVVVAEDNDASADMQTVSVENIPPNMKIVDIGTQTVRIFQERLHDCHTIFWNGPMGIYEIPLFATGTKGIANYLADLEATTIVAGGSTAEVVDDLKLANRMTFVSTGGGASLEFLSGVPLPGVKVLPDREALSVLVKTPATTASK
jgi:phosphoglycerate kinase